MEEKKNKDSSEIERLQKNFKQMFSKKNVILYDQIYKQSFSESKNGAFAAFLEKKELLLSRDDIFAGQIQHYLMRFNQPLPGDGEPCDFDPSVIKTGAVNPPENAGTTAKMCACHDLTWEEKEALSYLEPGVAAGYFTHYPVGHAITGFPFVLHTGFEKITELITEGLSRDKITVEQRKTGQAMLETVKSCQSYFRRYAAAAKKSADFADTLEEKKRFQRMEQAVSNITEKPAESFFEALQFIILLQELILTQMKGSMSLGRMDVLLFPYLKKDLQTAVESQESAQKLIDAWMIKLAGCMNGYQNVTLGGCDKDGNYAGNEVSIMILRSARRLHYDQPLLSFRLNEKVPAAHWEEIIRTLEKGGGFPALFWDDTIIDSRTKLGVSLEDARDYGIVGCVEPSICGKEFSNTEAMRINWCKTLELMLNGGICPVTGEKLFLKEKKELNAIESFEEFLNWYRSELSFAIEQAALICNIKDRHFYEHYPATLLSVTLEDCINRLDDCGHKGCRYCNSAINHTGVANAVDSLLAIRQLVFEERKCSLMQLVEILNQDYKGNAEMLTYIKEKVPKYGNNLAEVDSLMACLVNETAEKTQSIRNERGGYFLAGYYSVYHHAAMGRLTGALADGKRKGESLANGLSPAQGADRESPTAVINSMAELDQSRFANGMVLDLKLNPSFFHSASNRSLLRSFVEVYFKQGGMELQLNVLDKQTLLDAKAHPENYGNLLVRVSGFSAYFVNLFEELQDEIIKRTEYTEEN